MREFKEIKKYEKLFVEFMKIDIEKQMDAIQCLLSLMGKSPSTTVGILEAMKMNVLLSALNPREFMRSLKFNLEKEKHEK